MIRLVNPLSTTTSGEIRATKIDLDTLLEGARRWKKNPIEEDAVWLYFQSDAESSKRALVVDGYCEILGTEFDSPLLGDFGLEMNLAIKRYQYWENETSFSTGHLTVTEGDYETITSTQNGTADGRISYFSIDGISNSIKKAWIGIMQPYTGVISGFNPLWEAEDGTSDSSTASVVAVSDASGGSVMSIDPASNNSLARRFHIKWSQVFSGGWTQSLVGKYLVLFRSKLTNDTTQFYVQLRAGYGRDGAIVGGAYVDGTGEGALDGTFWHLLELGEVQIPPEGNRDAQFGAALADYALTIYAERLEGTGDLYFDYLYLVPAEHLLTIVDETDSYIDEARVYTDPDGVQYLKSFDSSNNGILSTPGFHNWFYPSAGGALVMAAEEHSNHSLGRPYDVYFNIYYRWLSYRT